MNGMKTYPDIEGQAIAYMEELCAKAKAYDAIKDRAINAKDAFSLDIYKILGIDEDTAYKLLDRFWGCK